MFIRYLEYSKGFVFLGEQVDRSMTEIESWDVIFFENDFLNGGKIDRNTTLYEMEEQDNVDL